MTTIRVILSQNQPDVMIDITTAGHEYHAITHYHQ